LRPSNSAKRLSKWAKPAPLDTDCSAASQLSQVGDADNMHTEGEQKFCISHILKNIKVRFHLFPRNSPISQISNKKSLVCHLFLHLSHSSMMVTLSHYVNAVDFFSFPGSFSNLFDLTVHFLPFSMTLSAQPTKSKFPACP
jgi:hypothetical protein